VISGHYIVSQGYVRFENTIARDRMDNSVDLTKACSQLPLITVMIDVSSDCSCVFKFFLARGLARPVGLRNASDGEINNKI
jgi:hypothetical protein